MGGCSTEGWGRPHTLVRRLNEVTGKGVCCHGRHVGGTTSEPVLLRIGEWGWSWKESNSIVWNLILKGKLCRWMKFYFIFLRDWAIGINNRQNYMSSKIFIPEDPALPPFQVVLWPWIGLVCGVDDVIVPCSCCWWWGGSWFPGDGKWWPTTGL